MRSAGRETRRIIPGRGHAVAHRDAVGTIDRAGGAVAAADGAHVLRQIQELLARHGELAVAFGVGQEAQHVRHRHALVADAVAGSAHAAILRADRGELRGQQLLVLGVYGSAMARRFSSS